MEGEKGPSSLILLGIHEQISAKLPVSFSDTLRLHGQRWGEVVDVFAGDGLGEQSAAG